MECSTRRRTHGVMSCPCSLSLRGLAIAIVITTADLPKKVFATPQVFQTVWINNLAAGLEREGLGSSEWDPVTRTMTHFDWDFLEGDQPGGRGNLLSPDWLTMPLGTGTNGAALWELSTGEDVFPDPLTSLEAREADDAISTNGFPNFRVEFLSGGQFRFYDFDLSADQEVLVGEGSIGIIPEPTALALVCLGGGLATLSIQGRKVWRLWLLPRAGE